MHFHFFLKLVEMNCFVTTCLKLGDSCSIKILSFFCNSQDLSCIDLIITLYSWYVNTIMFYPSYFIFKNYFCNIFNGALTPYEPIHNLSRTLTTIYRSISSAYLLPFFLHKGNHKSEFRICHLLHYFLVLSHCYIYKHIHKSEWHLILVIFELYKKDIMYNAYVVFWGILFSYWAI